MKVTYQEIINHLSENPSKELISEKLFQLGHEHEIEGDIFDLELTPNRGDCLSLIGLARDLNIFFGNSNALEIYKNNIEELEIDFKNLSIKDCPKISFLEIEIDEIRDNYKKYLENYFCIFGINKTNLFTDISNYISYELGQPTHCFDSNTMKNKLVFENKSCDSIFETLLDSKIKLDGYNCVFSMGDEIISLAGVMGGKSTACSTKTKKVLVECAYFNPESIIGKSVKYNLNSDAAYKFERGVDIASQEYTLRRFIKILEDHAKIKTIKMKTFTSNQHEYIQVPVDVEKINRILGTQLEKKEYLNYLEKLGFNVTDKIKVPSFRHDIKTQNDLAEEVARVIGYNNISSSSINLNKILDKEEINKVSFLEILLTDNGFSEVINFPFTSSEYKKSIIIDNPLDSNRKYLRTCIKNSLVENLLYNERRQVDSIKLFEISDIYTKENKIKKKKTLGIIISGRLGNNYRDFSKKLDYEYLNKLLNESQNTEIFQICEIPRNKLNTKKKDKIFYVEILLDDIPNSYFSKLKGKKPPLNFVTYKPISEFPSSTRDFSFSITDISKVKEVIRLLENVSDKDEMIKNSFIFDFYKNKEKGLVKLGYRFIFQSYLKTLSDKEVNKKVKEIINPIISLNGVNIPGMSLEKI